MRYLHAGMIQHDPSGRPAFLHRTAEGKVYPFNHGYRKVGNFSHPPVPSPGVNPTMHWMENGIQQPIRKQSKAYPGGGAHQPRGPPHHVVHVYARQRLVLCFILVLLEMPARVHSKQPFNLTSCPRKSDSDMTGALADGPSDTGGELQQVCLCARGLASDR